MILIKKNAGNDTALHIACEHGNERVVELITVAA